MNDIKQAGLDAGADGAKRRRAATVPRPQR